MLKKIVCIGMVALGLVSTMIDQAEARFRRHSRGCSTCNPSPCNSCAPQGQMDPNAPMLNPNGPAPMSAPTQPPQPPAPAPQPVRSGNAA